MTPPGEPKPWTAGEAGVEAKRHAPATVRNRDPIVDVLRDILPPTGTVLEIASGSGEHVVHFAEAFPALHWQPSDPDPVCRRSIAAWSADSERANIAPPLDLDAASADWPITAADAVLCINMIHISPWTATEGLLGGAAGILPPGAPLFLYGPFIRPDVETAPSNRAFDRSLRERNALWGLRDLDDVAAVARRAGLDLEQVIEMPANNLSVVFRKA